MAKKKVSTAAKTTRKTTKTSTTKAKTTRTTKKTSKKASAPAKAKGGPKKKSTKSTARKATAPVTLTFDMVAARAYKIWQDSGCVPGRDVQNWKQAEAELMAEQTGG